MSKQNIIDALDSVSVNIDLIEHGSNGYAILEHARRGLDQALKGLERTIEYSKGDKRKIQELIRSMANNSDPTGAKKVLIRLCAEMVD